MLGLYLFLLLYFSYHSFHKNAESVACHFKFLETACLSELQDTGTFTKLQQVQAQDVKDDLLGQMDVEFITCPHTLEEPRLLVGCMLCIHKIPLVSETVSHDMKKFVTQF